MIEGGLETKSFPGMGFGYFVDLSRSCSRFP